MATFKMDDMDHCFLFFADSLDDAERKLRAIRTTATIIGWPAYTYRTNAVTMPFVAAWVYLTTWVRSLRAAISQPDNKHG